MEKHTSKSINLKFYCIQPIQIKDNDLVALIGKKVEKAIIVKNISEAYPKWFNKFNKGLYSSIIPIKIDQFVDIQLLKSDLENSFKVNSTLSLSEYLNEEETTYYLLFDYRLMCFVLFYELAFDISSNKIEQYIEYYENKYDLYNTIRNILVKENDESVDSVWTQKIKRDMIKTVINICKKDYNYNIHKESVFIENNTGNITNMVDLSILKSQEYKKNISEKIITLNNYAERLKRFKIPIKLNIDDTLSDNSNIYEYSLYHFNGRFHTILVHDVDDIYRYIPIQYHMQFMWFYLRKINNILEFQYNLINNTTSINQIDMQTEIVNDLISKIEILILHNEKFKLFIETDNENIYNIIQKDWNIEGLLLNSNRYINFFKDYLSRLYSKKTSKIEKKQNYILAFISILQFIALIGIWTDYLSLMDDELKDKADEIIPLFTNYANFELFNLVMLPSVVIIMTFFMFVYFIKK